jgi:hypothetical protein
MPEELQLRGLASAGERSCRARIDWGQERLEWSRLETCGTNSSLGGRYMRVDLSTPPCQY